MDKEFCRQIDEQLLVEEYVAGKLKGELLQKFEHHVSYCEKHAQAVALEKAMRRGISEFARGEIKAKLRDRIKQKEDARSMLLRYAAILLVAVITPLLIYYQFNIVPDQADLPAAPGKLHRQITPVDSQKQEKSVQERSETESSRNAIESSTTPAAKLQKENITPEEEEAAEQLSDLIEPLPQKSEEAEKEKIPQSPVDEESALTRLAAEDAAEKPASVLGSQSIGLAGAGQRKAAVTSEKTEKMIYVDIKTRAVRDSLRLKSCMETHLHGENLSDYTIKLKLTILPSGEIDNIEILNASARSESLEECLLAIVRQWLVTPGLDEVSVEIKLVY